MRKLISKFIISIAFTLLFTGCDLEVDDSEKRTYNGVVYDEVIYNSVSDGVKCLTYNYYLFNETDNMVLKHVYYTCGEGTVREYKGIWDGSFEDKIIAKIDENDETIEITFNFDDYKIYDMDGNEYIQGEVKTEIIYMSNRSHLKYR